MTPLHGLIGRCAVALAAIALLAAPALAAESDHELVNSAEIKWSDAPPTLPKGAKIAVLQGDPGKSGPFVVRLMVPGNYKIAPHWHSQAESLTVISGLVFLGGGDTPDRGKAHALRTGGFHYLPAKAHHYAFTKMPTVIQIHGEGPFDIMYVNPADDPQKAAKKG